MNLEFTPEARKILDDYLAEVRVYVKAAGADPDEVQSDIIDHVESELSQASQPIQPEDLREVMDRLGEPQGWVSQEEMPWWRKSILRLRRGPEDWRLAYLALALLVFGVILGWVFPLTDTYYRYDTRIEYEPTYGDPSGPSLRKVQYLDHREPYEVSNYNFYVLIVFAAASFLIARAALAVSPDGQLPNGQKWLIHPTLIAVYAGLAGLLLLWPIGAGAGLFDHLWHSYRYDPDFLGRPWAQLPEPRDMVVGVVAIFLAALMCAVTWTLAGLAFRRWPRLPEAVFRPFLNRRGRRVGTVLLVAGIAVLMLCVATAALTLS